jgi:hypothetical protein
VTLWSIFLLEKLVVAQVVKEYPTFYWIRKSVKFFSVTRHWVLYWGSSYHHISFEIHFNIILPFTPSPPRWCKLEICSLCSFLQSPGSAYITCGSCSWQSDQTVCGAARLAHVWGLKLVGGGCGVRAQVPAGATPTSVFSSLPHRCCLFGISVSLMIHRQLSNSIASTTCFSFASLLF